MFLDNLVRVFFSYFLNLGEKILNLIFSFLIIYLIYKIICNVFKGIFSKKVFNSRIEKSHLNTIESLILSIIRYSFITIVILLFIQKFVGAIGVTITSIIGVAIGFAAQNVLKDLFNGIFITFENQFTVGDYITINKGSNSFSGIVDSVQARIIKLKDFNGDYHIVPNGLINQVTNHSREDSKILVDIQVSPNQKSENVLNVLNCVLGKFSHVDITVKPYIYGIVSVNEISATYRIVGYSKPLSHWGIENELRLTIMDEILDKNVILPVNRHSILEN